MGTLMGWHTQFEIFNVEVQISITKQDDESWTVSTNTDRAKETNETRRIIDRFLALLGAGHQVTAEDAKVAVEKVFRKLECNWTGWEFFDPTKR
jgi:hypothetical protein